MKIQKHVLTGTIFIIVLILILLFFTFVTFIFSDQNVNLNTTSTPINKIAYLDPPMLTLPQEKVIGKYLKIQINGYPKATQYIYINNILKYKYTADNTGNLSKEIILSEEGEIKVKANQILNDLVSNYSSEFLYTVDLTPPNVAQVLIKTQPPLFTKSYSINIEGSGPKEDSLLINNEIIKVNNGTFSHSYTLSEGVNFISVALEDSVGNIVETNKYKVYRDTKSPNISSGYCLNSTYNQFQAGSAEVICLQTSQWESYNIPGTVSIPINGYVNGENIESVTLAGKKIGWDASGNVNNNIWLYTKYGENRYTIEAKDKSGNKSN